MARHPTHRATQTTDFVTAAHNRACLFVLRAFRGFAGRGWREMPFREIGTLLWPALELEPRLLTVALKSIKPGKQDSDEDDEWPFDAQTEPAGDDSLDDSPAQPPDHGLCHFGRALLVNAPKCRRLFKAVEAKLDASLDDAASPLVRNVARLRDTLGLSELEARLLTACGAFDLGQVEAGLLGAIRSPSRMVKPLCAALGWTDEHEVRALLQLYGPLVRSGLLGTHPHDWGDVEEMLRLSRQGALLLRTPFASDADMAAAVLKPLPETASTHRVEWPHLESKTTLIRGVLRNALQQRARGINILLYGPPGTGKTEFARALAGQAESTAFSVEDTRADGMACSRAERLASLALTQAFAPTGTSLLVLDEAEDIFDEEYGHPLARVLGNRERGGGGKAWMNQLLESNRAPVIWIANQIAHMDPAYLRRFTYCLEFPRLPRPVRRTIAQAYLGALGCSPTLLDEVAGQDAITPALLASAARFGQLAAVEGTMQADETVRHVLADALKAMGADKAWRPPQRSTRFDLRYLNVKGQTTPQAVLAGLARAGRGTLLLNGPPGTGKTQLATEVAHCLGRELVCRTASDINSMWYGESERNVARMFNETDPASEVLFLDEAESLLGARDGAAHRADVAVTAEFLRHVEAYTGVFICATNHRSVFDSALMRRFTFRLDFLPMDAQQRLQMLCEVALGWDATTGERLPEVTAPLQKRLARLDRLTPGDFANAGKRIRMLQLSATVETWLDELEMEQAAKPEGSRARMGFVG